MGFISYYENKLLNYYIISMKTVVYKIPIKDLSSKKFEKSIAELILNYAEKITFNNIDRMNKINKIFNLNREEKHLL